MDERVHFWIIFRVLKNLAEVLLVVSFVWPDVLSHTPWSVVVFEVDILVQALSEEESQCSFTSFLGRCAFTTRFSCIFCSKKMQIRIHVILIKVRPVGVSWKKLLDMRLVCIDGADTLPSQFRLPLPKPTRAFILNFHLVYLILECYFRTYLPIGSGSNSC